MVEKAEVVVAVLPFLIIQGLEVWTVQACRFCGIHPCKYNICYISSEI